MSWSANDLMMDEDLVAYEANILSQFNVTDWKARRAKSLEDWLFPLLIGRGFDPQRLRTRHECDAVFGYTATVYADLLGASKDTSPDDVNLATVFATAGTDALYLGSKKQFRGMFFRLVDNVSSATGTMTASYWSGSWEPIAISDHTSIGGKTLAAGGSVTWAMPDDWQPRVLNGSDLLYWVKATLSATPTSAKATQIGVIQASALRAPVTFRTLQLIFQEAPTGADGPWQEKAAFYKDEAEQAFQRALLIIGGEFDTDNSDLISEAESEQTVEQAGGSAFTLERF